MPKSKSSHSFVKSFDGTKLFYVQEGQGKPLVFCYGLICSELHWTYQVRHFRKSYQTLWFDYRGHQCSDYPKDPSTLTLESLSRDLESVLNALKIDSAILLGHSMGVNVVLDFYKRQPHRVAGMILANGTAQRPLETFFGHNFFQVGLQLLKKAYEISPEIVSHLWKLQKSNPISKALVSRGGFNPHLTSPQDIQRYLTQVSETDPSVFIRLTESYEAYDATSWLHSIHVPTLILAGENDYLIPVAQQELMHQLIPRSELEIIRHGSHCPQLDLPDLVNLRIEKFLSQINYGSESNQTKESANQSIDSRQGPDPKASA